MKSKKSGNMVLNFVGRNRWFIFGMAIGQVLSSIFIDNSIRSIFVLILLIAFSIFDITRSRQ
jgi:hypothetical protein